MGNNNYFDELIGSYLSGNLNAEEEEFVEDWINSNAENKQYFEELRSVWNLLSVNKTVHVIDVDCEWDQFKQVIGTKQNDLYSTQSESFYNEVTEEVKPNKKAKIYKFFISTAVAASILFVIAVGWRLATNNASIEKPLALNNSGEIHSQAPFIRYQLNTTDKPTQLVLQDGSEVRLYANTMISYHEPFTDNKRDITLTGKADFKVAKDKTRPFTVFSGDISTTALGTRFTVTAFGKNKNITVRLYEGKVVVKSVNNAKSKLKKDFYLLPGQELIYDKKNLTAKVRTFREEGSPIVKNENKKETYPADNPSVPNLGNGTWFMFNNQSLEQVFDQLEAIFDAEIVYTKKDISNIYFIGTFNKSDSLEHILSQITELNNLKIIKRNNRYIIKR